MKNIQGFSLVNNIRIVSTYTTHLTYNNNEPIQITTFLRTCVSFINTYIIQMVNRRELTILR